MTEPGWNFKKQGLDDEEQGISEWDQFDKEELSLETTLLREATQNSLDARLLSNESGVVKVRIHWLSRKEFVGHDWFEALLEPLREHLDAAGRTPRQSDCAALVVEDFGTTGLDGETDDLDGNYRCFFYRHSSSNKGGAARGRWGLGKLVFAQLSAWSCWFGLTTRPDGRTLLLGKAVIGPRDVGEQRYRPFARWAGVENKMERPVEDAATLSQFRHAFGLQRGPDETVLSVVVPWPRSAPDLDGIRRSVLTEWAAPILRGRLVFDLQGEIIDAEAVRKLLPTVLDEGAARFVGVAASAEEPSVRLPEIRAYPEQKLIEERIDPATLEMLRASYGRGETVAVRVPVTLLPKYHEPAPSHVDILVAKADGKGFHLRLRDDLNVPHGGLLGVEGVHSALIAEPGLVAQFLADAEPPAHDTWTITERLRASWKYERVTLRLIRGLPKELHRLLTVGAERDMPDELLQFFWFDDPARRGNTRAGPKRKQRRTPDTPDDLPGRKPRELLIDKEQGGFAVRAGPGLTPDLLPCEIKIRMAYDLEGGDPFGSWSEYDFDLGDAEGDIEVEYEGVRSPKRGGNEILVTATHEDFRVRAHGFDGNRDLDVRVNRLRGSAP